jgi:hypothetical protein
MTMHAKSNGTKVPATAAVDKLAKLKPGGGISPESAKFLEERTAKFQRMTQGRGKAQVYGAKAKT